MEERAQADYEQWVHFRPPYGMDGWREAVFREQQCSLFADMCNFVVDRQALTVRAGLARFTTDPLVEASRVLALHRAIYLDESSEMYAAITTSLRYYDTSGETPVWTEFTMPTEAPLTTGLVGEFRSFKNKTYYTNYTDPVYMIRPGETVVTQAGLPDPNAKKDIQLCDDYSEWAVSGTGSSCGDDANVYHFTQGTGGVYLANSTAAQVTTLSITVSLDLTTFEDGSASDLEDYIAFSAFRFDKLAIEYLAIELGVGVTPASNYFSCYVYQDTGISGWMFSPKQKTMFARWANDPEGYRLFDVKLRKKWFTANGTADKDNDWDSITQVRIKLKAGQSASASCLAKVTIDNIRLLKWPIVSGPYKI